MRIQTTETIESLAGDSWHKLIQDGLNACQELDIEYAKFDFNGVEVCINRSTDMQLLWRDYESARDLGWATIGPFCTENYPEVVKQKLTAVYEAKLERKEQAILRRRQKLIEANERYQSLMVDDFAFTVPRAKQFDYGVARISDTSDEQYGDYCEDIYRLAEEIAKTTLALSRESGQWLGKHFKEASFLTETKMDKGFSGYQWSMAMRILETYWLYGDAVKRARLMKLL